MKTAEHSELYHGYNSALEEVEIKYNDVSSASLFLFTKGLYFILWTC